MIGESGNRRWGRGRRATGEEAIVAKGSVAELITQLEIAKEARLIEKGSADELIKEAEEIGAMLGALIKARLALPLGACLQPSAFNL